MTAKQTNLNKVLELGEGQFIEFKESFDKSLVKLRHMEHGKVKSACLRQQGDHLSPDRQHKNIKSK